MGSKGEFHKMRFSTTNGQAWNKLQGQKEAHILKEWLLLLAMEKLQVRARVEHQALKA